MLEYDVSLSETELRAAHPRRNPRVFVAVRRFAAVGSLVARLRLLHEVSIALFLRPGVPAESIFGGANPGSPGENL